VDSVRRLPKPKTCSEGLLKPEAVMKESSGRDLEGMMYLPSNHQKSKLAIPAKVIRAIRNIALYNDHRITITGLGKS
jgi:hypothetical protein